MATSLLLFCVKDAPAIMMATHADYSLQLIVESLFTGTNPSLLLPFHQDNPAITAASLANFSLQLIVDIFCKISFHFCEDYRIFCEGEYQYQDANGHQELTKLISGLIKHNGLIGRIIGCNGLINLVGFGLNGLDGFNSIISLVGSSASYARQLIGFIGIGIKCLISLVRLNGHISLVDLGRTSLTSIVGLIGLIGRIGLNGHNDGVGLVNNIEFEIPCYSFVREDWLWCVRRVLLSTLARLDSDLFLRHALQYAKQLFYSRFPQVTKYFVMRECEDSYTESLCCDSAFAHKKKFYIFKFPKRFSEIS
jgi:hypothetical protein